MSERISPADVAFLYLETPAAPHHVGGLAVFDQPRGGLDYPRLLRLIEERISLVPRYRQRLRTVPGGLANPIWVDDRGFDIGYHVRRARLPYPGRDEQLVELCAQLQSRALDRARPLWEIYLVEGLSDERIAVITKTHPSMVGGGAVDIAEVVLDASPEPRRTVEALWMPAPEPGPARLVAEALADLARRPAALADTVRLSVRDARSAVGWLAGAAEVARSVAAGALRAEPASPFTAASSSGRRVAVARAELADFQRVRSAARRAAGASGAGCTVHDVVLATVTGALRSWLLGRDEAVRPSATVPALVPMSMRGDNDVSGRTVTGVVLELPIGLLSAADRLDHIAAQTAKVVSAGRPVGADALVALSGFAPPTLHALGARAASGLTRRAYRLTVTNVPGPQEPRYAAGARMREMFPLLPVAPGQALAIGVSSYAGGVYFGVTADRDAVPDASALGVYLTTAIAELVRTGSARPVPAVRQPRVRA